MDPTASFWSKLKRYAGPGLLVSVGYMDPGNWATSIQAGASYGNALLFVVLLSSLAAIVLQCLSARLGIATGRDLAQLCRSSYAPWASRSLWLFAEASIVACDVAEVLGCALAFKLLLNVPLSWGILLTALDTVLVLGLKGQGFRKVEAIVLALIFTIGTCLVVELAFIHPDWASVARGLIPSLAALSSQDSLFLSVAILGATIMPHNLYLHSSIVGTRKIGLGTVAKRDAITFSNLDTIASLSLALLINGAILILAAAAFHATGHSDVREIDDAYHLLDPIAGTRMAGIIFGLGLLASGQSSTFTGTIAGQVIMEGFLQLKIPCWQRRAITRGLALVPAFVGVLILGEHSVGRLLVLSQVVLSVQLPFAMWPLIRLCSSSAAMGELRIGPVARLVAWSLFIVVAMANLWMVAQAMGYS